MKHRILLVEDNDQNAYLASYLLEKAGHEVVRARTGPEALTLAGRWAPNMVLLDIQLPEIDGYEVTRALRKDPAMADVPIIAVTSYAMTGDREKALAAGCTDYIEKPIVPETFVEQVMRYLSRPEGGA